MTVFVDEQKMIDTMMDLTRKVRSKVVDECAEAIHAVGRDWEAAGDFDKAHAAEYLANHVRSLTSTQQRIDND